MEVYTNWFAAGLIAYIVTITAVRMRSILPVISTIFVGFINELSWELQPMGMGLYNSHIA